MCRNDRNLQFAEITQERITPGETAFPETLMRRELVWIILRIAAPGARKIISILTGLPVKNNLTFLQKQLYYPLCFWRVPIV